MRFLPSCFVLNCQKVRFRRSKITIKSNAHLKIFVPILAGTDGIQKSDKIGKMEGVRTRRKSLKDGVDLRCSETVRIYQRPRQIATIVLVCEIITTRPICITTDLRRRRRETGYANPSIYTDSKMTFLICYLYTKFPALGAEAARSLISLSPARPHKNSFHVTPEVRSVHIRSPRVAVTSSSPYSNLHALCCLWLQGTRDIQLASCTIMGLLWLAKCKGISEYLWCVNGRTE